MKFSYIKESVKKHASKIVSAFTGGAVVASSAVTAFAAGDTNEAVSAAQSMLQQATSTLNITNIVAIVGGGIAAVIGLFLAWWGVRKLMGMLMNVFKKGRVSL